MTKMAITEIKDLVLIFKKKDKQDDSCQSSTASKPQNRLKPIRDNYVVKALVTAIVAAIILIAAAIIANKQWGLEISSDNVILTFVGILATFVVVTNYAQVLEIKNDLHHRLTAINMKKRRFDNRITHSDKFDHPQSQTPKKSSTTTRNNVKSDTTNK